MFYLKELAEGNAEAVRLLREELARMGRLAAGGEAEGVGIIMLDDGGGIEHDDLWPGHRHRRRASVKIDGMEYPLVGHPALGDVAYLPDYGGLAWFPAFPLGSLAEGPDGSLAPTQRFDEHGYLEPGEIIHDRPAPALFPILAMGADRNTINVTGFFSLSKAGAWAAIPGDLRESVVSSLLGAAYERARTAWGGYAPKGGRGARR